MAHECNSCWMPPSKVPRQAAGSKRHPGLSDRTLEKTLMNIRKLDHVSFLVKDVERSRHFYGEVLGLREIPRPSAASNAGAWLTNDEHSFEVHLIGEAEAGRVAQTHTWYRRDELARGYGLHPAFEVDDLEAAIQHLRVHNVEIVSGL